MRRKVFKPVTMLSTTRSATFFSLAGTARRRTLAARTFLEEGFIDFRAINFEAAEFIDKKSVRQFAKMVNALASFACQFRQGNGPCRFIAGVLNNADVDPLAELLREFEQRLSRSKMCDRDIIQRTARPISIARFTTIRTVSASSRWT